jgi:GDP-L-fucose synthase
MNKNACIYVAGHRGMVGSAIVRALQADGFNNILTRTSAELDLRNQAAVFQFFNENKPEFVFLAAARVGGIHANNTYRAEFLYDNLMMEANIIEASKRNNVNKLLFLGSSCIYPKMAPQPLKEEYLLTGELEQTNEPYAIAKIAGLKLCDAYRHQYGCNFISAMPTNLYGPNDNYHPQYSHVLPALIRKAHQAKITGASVMEVWGSGNPRREFLHVDDLAKACLYLMRDVNEPGWVNVGTGEDITIRDLATLVCKTVGFTGDLVFDASKPDGTPRKLLDVSKIHALGWKHGIQLDEGIQQVYHQVLEQGIFEKVY